MTTPKLTHVFNMRAYFSKVNLDLGPIKAGPSRSITALTGGFIKGVQGSKGEGLDIEVIGGGSDWILYNPVTNMCHIDVRTQGKSADGERLFVHYTGYLELDEAGQKFITWSPDAKTTKSGDHHWWTNPIFETSSEKFKWIETTLFVGRGNWYAGDDREAVEYQIFAVDN